MNMTSEQTAGEAAVLPPRKRRRRRRRLVMAATVAVIAGGAAAVVVTDPFHSAGPSASPGTGTTALAPVREQPLSSQTTIDATLGYAHDYSVVVPASGQTAPSGEGAQGSSGQSAGGTSSSAGSQGGSTFTWLPDTGTVIHQGHRLYSVNGSPVVLLHGSTPAYRTLSEGMSGSDVQALNGDLVALGYAAKSELVPGSSYFGAATATALGKLQSGLGVPQTGTLALGQAVFLPTAARVTSVSATLGAPAQAGTPVLQASSTKRQVAAQLDATQKSDVAKGDKVTITLPDNSTTPGVVTSVGTVASSPASGNGSGSGSEAPGDSGSQGSPGNTATIEVDIKPADPKATGTLTQAPVQVTITTATVKHALVVPVDALLAQANGAYAVEVADAGGARRLVPVSLGIFDDTDGLVQVTSRKLRAGQSVVVPKI